MQNVLIVFVGSGLGGLFRYLLSSLINEWAKVDFPFAILSINIIGCFLAGFFLSYINSRLLWLEESFRLLLMVGFLGGFTTFSAFSLDCLSLLKNGNPSRAVFYLVLTVSLSLIFTVFGAWLGTILSTPSLQSNP